MIDYGIYPKQFRNSRIPIEKNRCFVLMPFGPQFDGIYGEIKKRLIASDYICNRADELSGSVPIIGNILREILRAHFIIADLTGQNPNVFYELGIAHSFKDAHNIVLVSQSVGDIPFDVRHLSTIIYEETNIKYLTSSISSFIKENAKYYNFFEALQRRGIISLIHEDKEQFLENYQRHFGERILIATAILNGDAESYSEHDICEVLDSSLSALYAAAADGSRKNLRGIMRILSALLCQCHDRSYSGEIARHILYETKLENYPISKNEIISLQTDLAITLATERVYFNEAMSWIIEYFSRSKSATVDLNRYSLEKFLLTSKDTSVDSAIINSILHDNCYIREHMADIAGEKRLIAGFETLATQLRREVNIYATSSIIAALGKIGNAKAFAEIVDWYLKNKDKILSTQHYFILKHIYLALLTLDREHRFVTDFAAEFAEHLTPSAIL
ncbi:hypothetical protein KQX63_04625 [Rhodopseudomonas palustris]|uniref:hypothetical protein n=1 Tax=Rhodopseudomonas palustris TaxID=1076 RepID=UPI0021F315C5|nr:hypothetical protein [Rhodopseudomonas palustris]UYO45316.1 hypothetical protein KQX63_04625 [Rhodopseudomonas palustris]